MSVLTKQVQRVVLDESQVIVCDGCGRESQPPPLVGKFDTSWPRMTPDGWYLVALIPGDRKEACCETCAINVIISLQAVPRA